MSQPVVALVRDLLFSSRIRETAQRLQYPFRFARTVEEFRQALAHPPGLVMIDLTAQGVDLEAALAVVDAAGRPAPVLAWTTHADWKATKPFHGRCDRVVTREQLTAELPELLRGFLEGGASGGPAAASVDGTEGDA